MNTEQSHNLPTGGAALMRADRRVAEAEEHVRYLLEGWCPPGMGVVESVRRVRTNPYASRTSSVIVDVLTSEHRTERLLLKPGQVGERTRIGSPWGAGYEAAVYRAPLADIPSFASPFVGEFADGDRSWLVLRWIDDALPVAKSPHPSGIRSAATWLGRFHDEASACLDRTDPRELNQYWDGVVVAWAELASANLGPVLGDESPVLSALPAAALEAQSLLGTHQTLVHGDLYPANVLTTRSAVIPVDWEWAGIGAGELDLAALMDAWPASTVAACADDYRRTRWPAGGVQGSPERFSAAKLFLAVRWLGGHPVRLGDPRTDHYLGHVGEALHSLGFAPRGLAGPLERRAR